MATHPNVDLLHRGFEAFDKGDLATIDGLFVDDIVWNVSGRSPLAGSYKGKEQVFGFFGTVMELTAGTFKIAMEVVLADDEHGVVVSTQTGTRPDGRMLSNRHVQLFRLRDGKVVEVATTSFDLYDLDAFWS